MQDEEQQEVSELEAVEEGQQLLPVEPEHIRIVEAVLFAAEEPLDVPNIKDKLPEGADVVGILAQLAEKYETAGFTLQKVGKKWTFKTAPDLAHALQKHVVQQRRLSRAALETLAIVAYHQPVTRAEIEDIRGVSVSKGTLDVLLESEWVKIRGRRRVPEASDARRCETTLRRPSVLSELAELLAEFEEFAKLVNFDFLQIPNKILSVLLQHYVGQKCSASQAVR